MHITKMKAVLKKGFQKKMLQNFPYLPLAFKILILMTRAYFFLLKEGISCITKRKKFIHFFPLFSILKILRSSLILYINKDYYTIKILNLGNSICTWKSLGDFLLIFLSSEKRPKDIYSFILF